jgi:hypothetical protein
MIPSKATRLRKHSLRLGILLVLVCILSGTRANAQGNDLINAAGKGDLAHVLLQASSAPGRPRVTRTKSSRGFTSTPTTRFSWRP